MRRLLRLKFTLGQFDNPYVNVERAPYRGKPEWKALGEATQRRAYTLCSRTTRTYPLSGQAKIYVRNLNPELAAKYGTVVDKPEQADITLIRLQTPGYRLRPTTLARGFHHMAILISKDPGKDSIIQLLKTVPTIVDLYIDRPAVIPEISRHATGLLVNFGASDAALLTWCSEKPGPKENSL